MIKNGGTQRGVALPETAMIIGMALMLIFGIAELALLGFAQAQVEGAAFVAAHSAAINSSGDPATDKTYAMSILASPFPQVRASDVDLTYPASAPGTIQAVVSKNPIVLSFPGGAEMVAGGGTPVNVTGIDMEPASVPSPGATPVSAIAVQATLQNYCAPVAKYGAASCVSRSLYLSQYDILTGSGNGANGQFAEWNCRYKLFPNAPSNKVTYPNTMPSDGGPGSQWDPSSSSFNEKSLYAFDTSTSQWGSKASC